MQNRVRNEGRDTNYTHFRNANHYVAIHLNISLKHKSSSFFATALFIIVSEWNPFDLQLNIALSTVTSGSNLPFLVELGLQLNNAADNGKHLLRPIHVVIAIFARNHISDLYR